LGTGCWKRIFGHTRDEVSGGSRNLHSEKHHNLYTSRNIIRMIKSRIMKWARHVEHIKLPKSSRIVLVERRSLARRRRILEDNSKLDIIEIGWGC
jgi:hypothetical protein